MPQLVATGDDYHGTFEIAGDKPKGTLTSVPFKVTKPYASFLVAGGPNNETRVELCQAWDNIVFWQTTAGSEE